MKPQTIYVYLGKSPNDIFLILPWLLALLWIAVGDPAIPLPGNRLPRGEMQTKLTLGKNERLIQSYIKEFGEAPPSANHLRVYAGAKNLPFYAFDGFGERFDYVRLGKLHYILRSFGRDGVQNPGKASGGGEVDYGIYHSGHLSRHSLQATTREVPKSRWYPAAQLAGTDSPDGEWNAHLYVDHVVGNRRLMVRQRHRGHLHLFASHDGVEEFLWLPDSKNIVFTATSSGRYGDGVFVWNLEEDITFNVLDEMDQTRLSPATREQGFFLSLLGVSTRGPSAFAFVLPAQPGPLNPQDFFVPENLISFVVAKNGKPTMIPRPPELQSFGTREFFGPLTLDGDLMPSLYGSLVQKKWLQLPLHGSLQTVLEAWQDFCAGNTTSALLPYGLWTLGALYNQAALQTGKREGDILRSYGAETDRALMLLPLAPRYLRGFAMHGQQVLMKGGTLPYRFAQFEH